MTFNPTPTTTRLLEASIGPHMFCSFNNSPIVTGSTMYRTWEHWIFMHTGQWMAIHGRGITHYANRITMGFQKPISKCIIDNGTCHCSNHIRPWWWTWRALLASMTLLRENDVSRDFLIMPEILTNHIYCFFFYTYIPISPFSVAGRIISAPYVTLFNKIQDYWHHQMN